MLLQAPKLLNSRIKFAKVSNSLMITYANSKLNARVQRVVDYIKEIYQFRYLIRSLVKRDFKGNYRHSFLGYLWHVITPAAMIVIYMIVFSTVFGREIDNYWLYLCSGIFPWHFFISSLGSGTNCMVTHAGMIQKMYFPREALIYANAITNLITFLISYVLVIVLMILTGCHINIWSLLIVPVIIFFESVFVIGLTLALSSIDVYVRDVSHAIRLITMLWVWVTPVMYLSSINNGALQTILWVNPMTYFIESFHSCVYYGQIPTLEMISISFLLAAAAFVAGILIFKRLERGFAERL